MLGSSTHRLETPRVPVRTLKATVVAGPDKGKEVVVTQEKLSVGTAQGNDLILSDRSVSRYHLDMIAEDTSILVIDHGSTNGTYAGPVRIKEAFVRPDTRITMGNTKLIVTDAEQVDVLIHDQSCLGGIKGRTPTMRRLMAQVLRIAPKNIAVLLQGESGTGKEVIAQAIHDFGPRKESPFVTVDCGALSPTLVESELFGHEKGSFTGAGRLHIGAFERASGGTVFLDEIAELPASSQAKLLGVLERRRLHRVGGQTEIPINVRVISATHRELRAEVNKGRFREDLYYRLAVYTMQIPPLRARADDILLLANHFLAESDYPEPLDTLLAEEEIRNLSRHHWPGNVRELRNFIEVVVAMGEAPDLDGPRRNSLPGEDPTNLKLPYKEARKQAIDNFEIRFVQSAVKRAGGNMSRAARETGIARSHLYDLVRRHNIDFNASASDD